MAIDSETLNKILKALEELYEENPIPTPHDIKEITGISIKKIEQFFEELDITKLNAYIRKIEQLQKIRKEQFYSKMYRKAVNDDKVAMRMMHDYYDKGAGHEEIEETNEVEGFVIELTSEAKNEGKAHGSSKQDI